MLKREVVEPFVVDITKYIIRKQINEEFNDKIYNLSVIRLVHKNIIYFYQCPLPLFNSGPLFLL